MEKRVREHITFSGQVQGVGFRYKISHLAGHYGMTGWVRNEYDGTVSAELQGTASELDTIIGHLSDDRYIYLDEVHRERIELLPDEWNFEVRY